MHKMDFHKLLQSIPVLSKSEESISYIDSRQTKGGGMRTQTQKKEIEEKIQQFMSCCMNADFKARRQNKEGFTRIKYLLKEAGLSKSFVPIMVRMNILKKPTERRFVWTGMPISKEMAQTIYTEHLKYYRSYKAKLRRKITQQAKLAPATLPEKKQPNLPKATLPQTVDILKVEPSHKSTNLDSLQKQINLLFARQARTNEALKKIGEGMIKLSVYVNNGS